MSQLKVWISVAVFHARLVEFTLLNFRIFFSLFFSFFYVSVEKLHLDFRSIVRRHVTVIPLCSFPPSLLLPQRRLRATKVATDGKNFPVSLRGGKIFWRVNPLGTILEDDCVCSAGTQNGIP